MDRIHLSKEKDRNILHLGECDQREGKLVEQVLTNMHLVARFSLSWIALVQIKDVSILFCWGLIRDVIDAEYVNN